MVWIAISFLLGLGIGLSTVVFIAWLEVWEGAKVKDRYVGLPHQVAVPLDNWMKWIKEKDQTRDAITGMSKAEIRMHLNKWLKASGYREFPDDQG